MYALCSVQGKYINKVKSEVIHLMVPDPAQGIAMLMVISIKCNDYNKNSIELDLTIINNHVVNMLKALMYRDMTKCILKAVTSHFGC